MSLCQFDSNVLFIWSVTKVKKPIRVLRSERRLPNETMNKPNGHLRPHRVTVFLHHTKFRQKIALKSPSVARLIPRDFFLAFSQ